jgi:uncharacterized membrane protein YfcA
MSPPSTDQFATWGILVAFGTFLGLYVRSRSARRRNRQMRRRALRWMGLCVALVGGLGVAVAILASPAAGFAVAVGFLVVLRAGAGFAGRLRRRSRPASDSNADPYPQRSG